MYYHYCSVATFKKIMKSKVLWLSNLTESNDIQEVTRTFDNLWSAVKARLWQSDLDPGILKAEINLIDSQFSFQPQVFNPFGVCFCQQGDVLQQWLEYGDKTKGIALGFDFDWFNGLKRQMPHPSAVFDNAIGYDNTLYHSKQLEDVFYKICHDAIMKYELNAWMMAILPTFKHYSAFIKNPTFYGELETRIVYYPNNENFSDNVLQISSLETSPFPHYCLPWTKDGGDNALKDIVLGCNCELTIDELKGILSTSGLSSSFNIIISECSYRLR